MIRQRSDFRLFRLRSPIRVTLGRSAVELCDSCHEFHALGIWHTFLPFSGILPAGQTLPELMV